MPYILSPSTLSLLKDCPRCFWLHMKKQQFRPTGIYPSLPYGIDKAMKTRFDYYREHGGLPVELLKLKNEGIALFDNVMLALWRGKGIQWKDEQGHILKGVIDDILQQGNKVMVLKYVTRGFAAKKETISYYQNQLDIYTWLLQKNGYPTEESAYVVFYYPKTINWQGDVWMEKEVHKVKVSVKNAEKLMRSALMVLEGNMPEAEKKCGYCQWKYL